MKMPHARTWQKILAKSIDANTTIRVISKAQSYYEKHTFFWD